MPVFCCLGSFQMSLEYFCLLTGFSPLDKSHFITVLKPSNVKHEVKQRFTATFTIGEEGNHIFLRKQTIATGGTVCDCHYVRKSAVTQKEIAEAAADKRKEALRGGRSE